MLNDHSGLGGCHSRIIGSATQAVPKAPQRKRPCRSRALSLILDRSFVELRVREPRLGARSVSHPGMALQPLSHAAYSLPNRRGPGRIPLSPATAETLRAKPSAWGLVSE
jgi:hypothetical protein